MRNDPSPLVSVVIPVYNRAHLIRRALDSVISQTYKNYEVIIIDDCSADTDLLLSNLKKYQDFFDLVYVRHEENLHGAAARNTGIRRSKGEYIAFLDSDDVWLPNKLELMVTALLQTSADFAFSKLKIKGIKDGVFPKRKLLNGETYPDYLLVNGGAMQTSTLVVKRKILNIINFDEKLQRFQDYDLVVSLYCINASVCFVDHILTVMFDDDQPGRISNSINPEPAINWIKKVRPFISDKAYAYFIASRVVKYLIYSERRQEARHYLKYAEVVREVPVRIRMKYYFLSFLPTHSISGMRWLARKLKST